jgi:hypothetical protein
MEKIKYTGNVTDPKGNPVVGVKVLLTNAEAELVKVDDKPIEVETDGNGDYAIQVPELKKASGESFLMGGYLTFMSLDYRLETIELTPNKKVNSITLGTMQDLNLSEISVFAEAKPKHRWIWYVLLFVGLSISATMIIKAFKK